MMIKIPAKHLTYLLVSGLALILLQTVLVWNQSTNDFVQGYDLYYDLLPPWASVSLAIFAAPVIEEFGFRQCQEAGKRYIVGPLLMLPLLVGSWLLFVAAVVGVVLYHVFYGRINPWVIIGFSTLLFAAAHLTHMPVSSGTMIFSIGYVGLGLVFSFVRLRFSLIAAMVVHCAWNLLAIGYSQGSSIHFSERQWNIGMASDSAILKRYSFWEGAAGNTYCSDTSMNIQYGSAKKILECLFDRAEQDVLKIDANPYERYSLVIRPKEGTEINKAYYRDTILRILGARSDTSTQIANGYRLRWKESDSQMNADTTEFLSSGYGKDIARILNEQYEVPIITDDTAFHTLYLNPALPLKARLLALSKKYGIESTLEQVVTIVISIRLEDR